MLVYFLCCTLVLAESSSIARQSLSQAVKDVYKCAVFWDEFPVMISRHSSAIDLEVPSCSNWEVIPLVTPAMVCEGRSAAVLLMKHFVYCHSLPPDLHGCCSPVSTRKDHSTDHTEDELGGGRAANSEQHKSEASWCSCTKIIPAPV